MAPGFGFNMSYTVNFERATADYDIARGAESLKLAFENRSEIIKVEGIDGYVNELAYFIECIREDRVPAPGGVGRGRGGSARGARCRPA